MRRPSEPIPPLEHRFRGIDDPKLRAQLWRKAIRRSQDLLHIAKFSLRMGISMAVAALVADTLSLPRAYRDLLFFAAAA